MYSVQVCSSINSIVTRPTDVAPAPVSSMVFEDDTKRFRMTVINAASLLMMGNWTLKI